MSPRAARRVRVAPSTPASRPSTAWSRQFEREITGERIGDKVGKRAPVFDPVAHSISIVTVAIYVNAFYCLYAPASGNKTDLRYSQDHAVWALSMLGLTLWPLGYPDKARDAAATALTWAGEIQHAVTTGFAYALDSALWGDNRGSIGYPRGDLGEAALAYCLERDLRAYIPWADQPRPYDLQWRFIGVATRDGLVTVL